MFSGSHDRLFVVKFGFYASSNEWIRTSLLCLTRAQIVLTEMYYDGFHRSFCDDDDDLDIIQESDSIFAFETPELFRPEQIRCKRGGTASRLFSTSYF